MFEKFIEDVISHKLKEFEQSICEAGFATHEKTLAAPNCRLTIPNFVKVFKFKFYLNFEKKITESLYLVN